MDSGGVPAGGETDASEWEPPEVWRPTPPSQFQVGLAVVNIIVPVVLLGWAWANGHTVFFEWQTLGGCGLLVALGVDTLYIRWLTSGEAVRTVRVPLEE